MPSTLIVWPEAGVPINASCLGAVTAQPVGTVAPPAGSSGDGGGGLAVPAAGGARGAGGVVPRVRRAGEGGRGRVRGGGGDGWMDDPVGVLGLGGWWGEWEALEVGGGFPVEGGAGPP